MLNKYSTRGNAEKLENTRVKCDKVQFLSSENLSNIDFFMFLYFIPKYIFIKTIEIYRFFVFTTIV